MCRKQKSRQLDLFTGEGGTINRGGVAEHAVREHISEAGAKPNLLEKILESNNMNRAFKQVRKKKGACGIDGMDIASAGEYLHENKEQFLEEVRSGKYRPQPVKRVEIPKPSGGKRKLGIPTVIDRVLQQAVNQVLTPIFEPFFSDNSYGFRAGRSAHQAILKAKEYYQAGYYWVVDLDLSKYFDTINHELLLNMIRKKVEDKQVVTLIKRFLKSGVMVNGVRERTEEGSPQGGNLSPLLSNIYLTQFDKELERRGHRFVRYADDVNIYVKSKQAAERVMSSCIKYLEGKLKLKVYRDKSKTGSPLELKFLGFKLWQTKDGKEVFPTVHGESLKRAKEHIRELTPRHSGKKISEVLEKLAEFTTGWLGYYGIGKCQSVVRELDCWIRRRIRAILLQETRKPKAMQKRLKELGINPKEAAGVAYSSSGIWRRAMVRPVNKAYNNNYLESLGFKSMLKTYELMHSRH